MVKRKRLLLVLFLVLMVSLGFLVSNKIAQKNTSVKLISTVPNFFFFDSLGNKSFFNEFRKEGLETVIFYFNSTCSLCHEEFYLIEKYLYDFEDTQLIFVSTEEFEDIRKFAEEFGLWGKEGLHFFQDKELRFGSFFHLETVPSTIVYDAEGRLLASFKGLVSIKKIIQLLHEES